MTDLILSILSSIAIMMVFKLFGRFNINRFQAIVTNYLTCFILGSLFCINQLDNKVLYDSNKWILYAISVGSIFICVFYLISYTTSKMGATVSTVAMKMSMVIPAVFGFVYYHDDPAMLKIAGIVAAVMAVVLVSLRKRSGQFSEITPIKYLTFPLIIFLFSGIADVLIKLFQSNFHTPGSFYLFLVFLFGTSFILGLVGLSVRMVKQKETIQIRNILAGILLGVPNYFSIFFWIRAMEYSGLQTSSIFPVNNISIVAGTSFLTFILFKERISFINLVGLLLAILSIILILSY